MARTRTRPSARRSASVATTSEGQTQKMVRKTIVLEDVDMKWANVVSFLDLAELRDFAVVCKQFRKVAVRENFLRPVPVLGSVEELDAFFRDSDGVEFWVAHGQEAPGATRRAPRVMHPVEAGEQLRQLPFKFPFKKCYTYPYAPVDEDEGEDDDDSYIYVQGPVFTSKYVFLSFVSYEDVNGEQFPNGNETCVQILKNEHLLRMSIYVAVYSRKRLEENSKSGTRTPYLNCEKVWETKHVTIGTADNRYKEGTMSISGDGRTMVMGVELGESVLTLNGRSRTFCGDKEKCGVCASEELMGRVSTPTVTFVSFDILGHPEKTVVLQKRSEIVIPQEVEFFDCEEADLDCQTSACGNMAYLRYTISQSNSNAVFWDTRRGGKVVWPCQNDYYSRYCRQVEVMEVDVCLCEQSWNKNNILRFHLKKVYVEGGNGDCWPLCLVSTQKNA